MFDTYQISVTGGDETALYRVNFSKKYTIKEFITEALNTCTNEHGVFRYKRLYSHDREWIYICSYDRGELKTIPPDDILDKKIVRATAVGGWGLMDYNLMIED